MGGIDRASRRLRVGDARRRRAQRCRSRGDPLGGAQADGLLHFQSLAETPARIPRLRSGDARRKAGEASGPCPVLVLSQRRLRRRRVGFRRGRRRHRPHPVGGASGALRRGGLAGAAATLFGVSTGACSVTGCGAPVLPVLGLAFVGLESGTLHFLAQSSRVATLALFAVLGTAVSYLAWRTGDEAFQRRRV